jgi:predicted O-linked N-acetylglucosamine transferase (SPINDLY family)
MASRVASSLLTAIGMEEMITASPREYEERAYHLASHEDELRQIREKLAENRHSMPLFDTVRQVRNLEAAYQAMFQRHLSGRAPASFHVDKNVTH